MIAKHQYPKEWFFAVVNWGIAGVLEKGGGMLRREWRARGGQAAKKEPGGKSKEEGATKALDKGKRRADQTEDDAGMDEDELGTTDDGEGVRVTGEATAPVPTGLHPAPVFPSPRIAPPSPPPTPDDPMDFLTASLASASLGMVPRAVLRSSKTKNSMLLH